MTSPTAASRSCPRSGALLILVAGVCALLAGLTLTFLVRMRDDADGLLSVEREVQARMMLLAGCDYILEASRLGYDTAAAGQPHEEAFGWVDVRDGKLGPKPTADGVDDDHLFPLGAHARCPMHILARPPYAIEKTMVYNPIETDPASPAWGRPYLRNPDPRPMGADFADFVRGDAVPRASSTGKAWFRIYREPVKRDRSGTIIAGNGRRFVITCGAGATHGFRDWGEVTAEGRTATFGGDRELFEEIRMREVRLWYRVEWSAAVLAPGQNLIHENINREGDNDLLAMFPMNASDGTGNVIWLSQPKLANPVGSIAWVERLREEPSRW